MKLGAFSVSLSVKDIVVSKQFYETLGFTVFAGDPGKKYLIMKNEQTLVGLFQGMFENNILTFNPGWGQEADVLESFDDVRQIRDAMKAAGFHPVYEACDTPSGPASFMIADPDGNMIMVDQHV